jgi:hypothetical protein
MEESNPIEELIPLEELSSLNSLKKLNSNKRNSYLQTHWRNLTLFEGTQRNLFHWRNLIEELNPLEEPYEGETRI